MFVINIYIPDIYYIVRQFIIFNSLVTKLTHVNQIKYKQLISSDTLYLIQC